MGGVINTFETSKVFKSVFFSSSFNKGADMVFKNQVDYWRKFEATTTTPPPSHQTRHHYLVFNGKSNVCASSDSKAECPICVYINFQSTRFAFHMRQPDMDTATRDSAKSSNKFPLLHEILFKILKVSYKTKIYCINLWL